MGEVTSNDEMPGDADLCPQCSEGFVKGDRFSKVPHCGMDAPSHLFWHYECLIRMTMGSVAHQERMRTGLGCNSECADDPALTPRQAAKAAEEYWERTRRRDEA